MDVVNFFNKYIIYSTEHLEQCLAKLQINHHTKRCRRSTKRTCRYNFPVPPFPETMIFEPLVESSDTISTNATNIFSTLQKAKYDSSFTYDMFLNELQLTKYDYVKSIRSTLDRPTLFLK